MPARCPQARPDNDAGRAFLECGDPYYLTVIDGDWFLVGYCHLREVVLMFAPARIRELREAGSLV